MPLVISRNRESAIAALAVALGQDMKWLDYCEIEEDEEVEAT
ncbi:hypothetical protein BSU04_11335 [Caballeronia sordidicola]|uniref:Uncharacterized protein n=1 Tax=Caballeronia sordidicola TaxID=196367 RepID=A0A226X6A8_CABSO|nr:hypothetical protein BSU04_11335 [Caballeronia sordidicola]